METISSNRPSTGFIALHAVKRCTNGAGTRCRNGRGIRAFLLPVSRRLKALRVLLLFGLFLGTITVAAAETVRPAVWAGRFYPADAALLRRTLSDLADAADRTCPSLPAGEELRALVLPHAGYVYSGLVAAHAHRALKGERFDKVILMGPDHRVGFTDGAVSGADAYATPLGRINLDGDARRLCSATPLFRRVSASDRSEHCLEVVLPFLQAYLTEFSLVPIVLGPCNPRRISLSLAPLINAQTLMVVSSDLSHYLPYDQAVVRDKETIQAILDLDPAPLLTEENRACGRYPLAVLIDLARALNWRPILLRYANSGDTAGDRKAVVGYAAFAFYGEPSMTANTIELTPAQGQALVRLARYELQHKLAGGEAVEEALDPALERHSGIFVTLKIAGNLRGCIGNLGTSESLVDGVRHHAIQAAFHDPRFQPLSKEELSRVTIEVSVLTDPQPLAYDDADDLLAKLRPHVDGVTLHKGYAQATFLPQVWEQLPRAEDFLSHLCMKAGLGANEWRQGGLEIETYQVQYFEEPH